MPFWQFLATLEGYRNQMDNMTANSVWTGFWSAYYSSSSKSKKSPAQIIKALRAKVEKHKSAHVNTVDVDAFLEKERRFNERLNGR